MNQPDTETMTDEERADDITHITQHTYHHRHDCQKARELRELLGRAIDHIHHYQKKTEMCAEICHCHNTTANGNLVTITEDCNLHRDKLCDCPAAPVPHRHSKANR